MKLRIKDQPPIDEAVISLRMDCGVVRVQISGVDVLFIDPDGRVGPNALDPLEANAIVRLGFATTGSRENVGIRITPL